MISLNGTRELFRTLDSKFLEKNVSISELAINRMKQIGRITILYFLFIV